MIDPYNIINTKRSRAQLEELLLFCILVANKEATSTAKRLDELLEALRQQVALRSPFRVLSCFTEKELVKQLKEHGFGLYNQKARTIMTVVQASEHDWLDLKKATVEDLLYFTGIGPKTAEFFLMSSRANYRGAVLDTHVLKWMRKRGIKDVPSSTPSDPRVYQRLAEEFLTIAESLEISPRELDQKIWRQSAKGKKDDRGKQSASVANRAG